MASELYNTIDAISREKGIDPQIVVSAVEDAIVVATRKYYKTQENLRAVLDKDSGQIRAFAVKTIVDGPESIQDPLTQMSQPGGHAAAPVDVEVFGGGFFAFGDGGTDFFAKDFGAAASEGIQAGRPQFG